MAEQTGLVRVDPTAAVSPARIQAGIAAAVPAGEPLPVSVRGNWQLLNRIRFTWDAMANFWNQWVLGYTPERQTKLLTDAGFRALSWQTLAVLLMSVAGLWSVCWPRLFCAISCLCAQIRLYGYGRFLSQARQTRHAKRPGEGPPRFCPAPPPSSPR